MVNSGPPFILSKAQCSVYCLHWMVWLGVQEKTKNGDIRVCFEKPTELLRKSAICLLQIFIPTFGKKFTKQLQHFKAFIVHILWFCIMASLISFYLYDSICVCICMYVCILFFLSISWTCRFLMRCHAVVRLPIRM